MKHIPTVLLLSTATGLSLGVAPAHAQTTPRFSTVEFKDTTLNSALEMIFQAANNPTHTIDPAASQVAIGSITLQNIQWDSALRALANQNNFKVSRGADGSYLVEPREPILQPGAGGLPGAPSAFPGMGRTPGGIGNVPANPFGGAPLDNGNNTNFELVPSVSIQANAQTVAQPGGTGTSSTAGKKVILLTVRHIYAGGIAQLFNNSSVIATEPFVSPPSSGGGGGGGSSFGGNRGGGNSSFGGGNNRSGSGGGFGVTGIGGGSGSSFGGGGSSFGGGGGGSSFGGGGSRGFGF